jgi:hypothetical protein
MQQPAHGLLAKDDEQDNPKGRVHGVERDATKTGEDRRVELYPRAIAILESHLAWRDSLVRTGHIQHDALFFTHDYRAILDVRYPYERWRNTLWRLPLRYRKPYTARHTSVSWNLMLGKNPSMPRGWRARASATLRRFVGRWAKSRNRGRWLRPVESVARNRPPEGRPAQAGRTGADEPCKWLKNNNVSSVLAAAYSTAYPQEQKLLEAHSRTQKLSAVRSLRQNKDAPEGYSRSQVRVHHRCALGDVVSGSQMRRSVPRGW